MIFIIREKSHQQTDKNPTRTWLSSKRKGRVGEGEVGVGKMRRWRRRIMWGMGSRSALLEVSYSIEYRKPEEVHGRANRRAKGPLYSCLFWSFPAFLALIPIGYSCRWFSLLFSREARLLWWTWNRCFSLLTTSINTFVGDFPSKWSTLEPSR